MELGRNLERLQDESGGKQREQDRDEQRLENLGEAAGDHLMHGGGLGGAEGSADSATIRAGFCFDRFHSGDLRSFLPEYSERDSGSSLFRFLLAAALGCRKPLASVPDFHLECFLMLGPGFIAEAVFGHAEPALLKPFLQRGFVVGALEAFDSFFERGIEQAAAKKRRRRAKPPSR